MKLSRVARIRSCGGDRGAGIFFDHATSVGRALAWRALAIMASSVGMAASRASFPR